MTESPFEIDVEKLLSQILMIAAEDSQITDEENALLTSITKGLKEYEDLLKKHIEDDKISIEEATKLEQQLSDVVTNSIKVADEDKTISEDEQAIILSVATVTELAVSKQLDYLHKLLEE